jgi:hypothetical protein
MGPDLGRLAVFSVDDMDEVELKLLARPLGADSREGDSKAGHGLPCADWADIGWPRVSYGTFDLLDAMDGAAPDADLLFLLTTNRADLLEPALAARPGRVDVAVEITLPDAPARERLLTLYGHNVPLALTDEDVSLAVERTDGTTASFIKELIRRSMLESLHDDPALNARPVRFPRRCWRRCRTRQS